MNHRTLIAALAILAFAFAACAEVSFQGADAQDELALVTQYERPALIPLTRGQETTVKCYAGSGKIYEGTTLPGDIVYILDVPGSTVYALEDHRTGQHVLVSGACLLTYDIDYDDSNPFDGE